MFNFIMLLIYMKFLGKHVWVYLARIVTAKYKLRFLIPGILQFLILTSFVAHILDYVHVVKYFFDGFGILKV